MTKWISVKDGMPDYQEEIIIFTTDKVVTSSLFVKRYPCYDKDELYFEKNGFVISEEEGTYFKFNEVTHWMPLPEPPKEKP